VEPVMNLGGCERRKHWHNLRHYSGVCLERPRKTRTEPTLG